MTVSSKPRSWLYMVLRVGGSVLILSLLFRFLPLEQMRRALGRLPPGLWLFVLAGYLGMLFLPSIVGGDIIRLGLAMRLARNRHRALLGSVIDRILDVTVLGGVAAFGAVLLPGALSPQHREVFWLLVGVSGCASWLWQPWRRRLAPRRR